jgi:hypothetical protein
MYMHCHMQVKRKGRGGDVLVNASDAEEAGAVLAGAIDGAAVTELELEDQLVALALVHVEPVPLARLKSLCRCCFQPQAHHQVVCHRVDAWMKQYDSKEGKENRI